MINLGAQRWQSPARAHRRHQASFFPGQMLSFLVSTSALLLPSAPRAHVCMEAAASAELENPLDNFMVFAVANEEKKPLSYTVNGKSQEIFYADVKVAMSELETAKAQHPDLDCDVVPIGLGTAHKM